MGGSRVIRQFDAAPEFLSPSQRRCKIADKCIARSMGADKCHRTCLNLDRRRSVLATRDAIAADRDDNRGEL